LLYDSKFSLTFLTLAPINYRTVIPPYNNSNIQLTSLYHKRFAMSLRYTVIKPGTISVMTMVIVALCKLARCIIYRTTKRFTTHVAFSPVRRYCTRDNRNLRC